MALTLIRPDLDVWEPGEHNGTFRGINPAFVTGAAALRAYWQRRRAQRGTLAKGERVAAALAALAQSVPGTPIEPRGRGLAHGLAFERRRAGRGRCPPPPSNAGLLVETAGPRGEVVKLLPPLTITDAELDEGLSVLADAVRSVC